MWKGYYLNRPHPDSASPEGSLKKDQTLLMSLNNTEKPNSELNTKEQILALNPTPNAEMTSADQSMPTAGGSELGINADTTPVIGDNTQMTQDQLTPITESVWQQIGKCLDAKCS